MQENVRFFDAKLHKSVYFAVCKLHKNEESVISMSREERIKTINSCTHTEESKKGTG